MLQTDKEFEERYTGLKIRPEMIKRTQKKFVEKKNFNLTMPPKEMDWRKLGCVTKIKFQVTFIIVLCIFSLNISDLTARL
jgi:hypothetical protein